MPDINKFDAVDPSTLIADPSFYLWRFEQQDAVFVEMDDASYERSIFLDMRISPASDEEIPLDAGELIDAFEAAAPPPPEIGYIFHVAHCGSTLLARALEFAGTNTVYREPLTLRQMSVMATRSGKHQSPPDPWRKRLGVVTALLGRSLQPAPVIVKANVPVNFIIPHLMEAGRGTRGLILHTTLENYLLSVLRTPTHKDWVKRLVELMGPGIDLVLGTNVTERSTLNAWQGAACLWRVQMALFTDALDRFEHLRTLDAEVLFARPEEVVPAAGEFLGRAPEPAALADLLESDLFTTYSKKPGEPYANERRLSEKEKTRAALGDAISQAGEWVAQRFDAPPLPERLPKPLIGDGSVLLAHG